MEKRYKLNPILVIVLTVFIDIIGFGIIIPLLPFYAETFQAGPIYLGILIASFAIMQFIFAPILGRASDKFGRKPVLLLSLFVSFVGFTIFAFANSYLILLLSRIIAGVATERAVAQAYIADITDNKTRTKQMGKIGAAIGAGFIFGPAIGGALSVFGFSVPGYLAMALTAF
ncbi:MFS transporter, partial [Candidatus Bathyarchaeota archaeon]|nr:MFS transporter [Candidatus Bathyarchaeota archaeon]